MSTDFTSSADPDRRDGLPDRRMQLRAPDNDRRLSSEPRSAGSSADGTPLRPPLEGSDGAPPTENTQLLFERS